MIDDEEAIQISGIERNPGLRARVTRLMRDTLAPLSVRPVKSQVSFFDDNGPKGGVAMRCALTVRLPYRPTLRIERSAVTSRLAFDAALPVLERQLERYRVRERNSKRHPKKYFAARRAMTGEAGSAPTRRARA
jgi:ribosome-associated translation inhibitor RaiA